uniref:Lectin, mannose binding 2 n=1 Tax=Molossus molossus TaxID=27622 RepID=A0A7J8I8I2_MOLMO|nr:lectin, mannose binding 2 [Molossus molossus]
MAAESWIRCWGWGRRCPARPGLPGPGPGPTTPLLILLLLGPVAADITDGNSEHLKREHSLIKPYQGVGSSSMPLWDFQGSTILTSQYVRLTPDERSKEGSIWNHQPCFLKDWEMHVHFKVHGAGKKNLHGDGIALWYTRDRLMPADQKMGKCPRVRINNNNNKNRAWQPFLHRASYANCTSGRSLHGTIRLCTGLPARTTLDSLPTLGSCPLSQPL